MLIGIVADDLTGAADSAAPFAVRGLHADVAFTLHGKLTVEMPESEARAWTTETRELPPERKTAITRLNRAATRRLKAFSPPFYYKKIDSTLRGHLRWELDAVRMELPGRMAIVCPAFPANGRTVRGGILHVHDVPKQRVRDAFSMPDDPTATEMSLNQLPGDAEQLLERWRSLRSMGVQTVFCDAALPYDLDTLAAALVQQPDRFLPVGSAGLSAALARQLLPDRPATALPAAVQKQFSEGRVIVIVGSLHPVSRSQARYLAGRANVEPIVSAGQSSAELRNHIRTQFHSGQRVVLVVTPEIPADRATIPLGGFYGTWAHNQDIQSGFLLTGGDTAMRVMEMLYPGIGIRVDGELEPGIVCGRLYGIGGTLGETVESVPVILKAGGFGTEETLARCIGL